MPTSAAQMTRDIIAKLKTVDPRFTIDASSTSTQAYELLNPIAYAIAPLGATAENVLFALSYLGARGRRLDNVCKDINVKRMEGETDWSLRDNAYKIFNTSRTFTTKIDPEEVKDENDQLDSVDIMTKEEIFTQMQARFFGPLAQGAVGLPLPPARLWMDVSYRAAELYKYVALAARNFQREDYEDISDTQRCYEFAALRVPGVRDVAVEISGYNELTLHVLVDERPGRDARNRRVVYNESEVLATVEHMASHYLPAPDKRVLEAPTLKVRRANQKYAYVDVSVSGTDVYGADVAQAVQDAFYDAKALGGGIVPGDITAAILAVPGVTSCVLGSPSPADLRVSALEAVGVGYINIVGIPDVEAYRDGGMFFYGYEISDFKGDSRPHSIIDANGAESTKNRWLFFGIY